MEVSLQESPEPEEVPQSEEVTLVEGSSDNNEALAITEPLNAGTDCQSEEETVQTSQESFETNGDGDESITSGAKCDDIDDAEITSPNKLDLDSDAESDDSYESESTKASVEEPELLAQKKNLNRDLSNGIKAIQHHQTLRKTMEPYIQTKSCEKMKLRKCLECKSSRGSRAGRRSKDSICRFVGFRKLRYTRGGSITLAGFSDVKTADYKKEDLQLWMPQNPPTEFSLELAKFLVTGLGDQFCELVRHEKQALISINNKTQQHQVIVWRKVMEGLRELCDVCSTTLFNYHWTCGKCGFVVCLSCFNTRKTGDLVVSQNSSPEEPKDDFGWLKCSLKEAHVIGELMLTQIIAGKALDILWRKLHDVRKKLKIPQECGCDDNSNEAAEVEAVNIEEDNEITKLCEVEMEVCMISSAKQKFQSTLIDDVIDVSQSGQKSTDNSAVTDSNKRKCEAEGSVDENNESTKRLCTDDAGSPDDSDEDEQNGILSFFQNKDSGAEQQNVENGNQQLACAGEVNSSGEVDPNGPRTMMSKQSSLNESANEQEQNYEIELINFVRPSGSSNYSIKVMPKNIKSSSESTRLHPNVPHGWLCNGLLLWLKDPKNPGNFPMFREQWNTGQPVLVSNVASNLDETLWTPASFSKDFGHKTNHLINCMTGKVVPSRKMKRFWDGFEHMKQRLQDDNGEPMLLKLKDWPPGDDFAEMLPKRFKDLMAALPLGEYTHRDGKLNLAARLPKIFSRPDLGPKMYIAYGSGLHLDKGTTNLHLDVSDAVNVMVYVGVVKDDDISEHNKALKAVMNAIDDSDCDDSTINRVRKHNELPGALWHIYEAKDADKIRDLLNKVALENGKKVERCHDSIHDQSWYLNRKLRKRLMDDYNVRGYPILQCAGDAVFVPAGAPHQVRNLNNCIKIAEDFVSPENVRHCFHLTEEFRNLTDTHTNHEDKLQIKNIVYHTIKDAVAVIESSFKAEVSKTLEND